MGEGHRSNMKVQFHIDVDSSRFLKVVLSMTTHRRSYVEGKGTTFLSALEQLIDNHAKLATNQEFQSDRESHNKENNELRTIWSQFSGVKT